MKLLDKMHSYVSYEVLIYVDALLASIILVCRTVRERDVLMKDFAYLVNLVLREVLFGVTGYELKAVFIHQFLIVIFHIYIIIKLL